MHFANQQGRYLDDQALIAAITSTVHRSRRLGSNDAAASVEYQNELEFSMSANAGLQWREDVTRRVRFTRLAFFEEDANSRIFTYPDLHGYVRQNRELILSAIYSLIMEWKRQGCPPGPEYTSFPRWGEVVGGILMVCGLGNPCLPPIWSPANSQPSNARPAPSEPTVWLVSRTEPFHMHFTPTSSSWLNLVDGQAMKKTQRRA
jgi:hypothetical protein